MRTLLPSLLTLLALWLPQHAAASGDMRPAFFAFASRVCIHQDPAHRSSPFGKTLASSPGFVGWEKFDATPVAQCLRKRNWVSAELCASAAQIDMAQKDQLNDWFGTHTADMKKLVPLFKFVNSPDAASGSCPEIQLIEPSKP